MGLFKYRRMSDTRGSWLFFLVFAAGLSGCASPQMIRLSHHPYDSRPADCDLPVFYGEDKVTHSYIEVCEFTFAHGVYTGDRNELRGPEMPGSAAEANVGLCKHDACKAGCDALLVEDADADGVDLNPAGRKQGRMVVIKGIKFVNPDAFKKEEPEDLLYLHSK